MIVAIIISVVFFVVLGVAALVIMKKIKDTDPSNIDSSVSTTVDSAQEFIPFQTIKDGLVHMGNHQYRAIIECSSLNYNLKTAREKEGIEASFQRFLNSLNHPIWFFVQTRVIDNKKMIDKLQLELNDAIERIPGMTEYAEQYFLDMQDLNNRIGNNKQKKKYVIVPYDDTIEMSQLTEDEKYEYAKKETYQRALMVQDGLSTVGMKCRILDDRDLIELVHSSYHKDNYSDAEFIANGEFTKMLVSGRNTLGQMSADAKLDHILYEAQTKINNEIAARSDNPALKKEYEDYIRELTRLRKDAGAYFKNTNGR